MPTRRKSAHLIAECFMRPSTGLPSWSRCQCNVVLEAATPELLVEATRAHRRAHGLATSEQQRSGDRWDGSFTVAV